MKIESNRYVPYNRENNEEQVFNYFICFIAFAALAMIFLNQRKMKELNKKLEIEKIEQESLKRQINVLKMECDQEKEKNSELILKIESQKNFEQRCLEGIFTLIGSI